MNRFSPKIIYTITILAVFLIASYSAADRLYDGFKNPPSSARPDVYWWWNGNELTETEITRELDVLHKAGIGGVLIFPMARTMATKEIGVKGLDWLSPEWCRMVKFTIDEARKRDINVDMLVGSGWPFGGPFLKEGEQTKKVQVTRKELTGPTTFTGNVNDLMLPPPGAYGERTNGLKPQLQFLRLVPRKPDSVNQFTDLMSKVTSDGTIEFDVPAGEYTLYTGTLREGFMIVNIPAPGGQGPVLDHFSGTATSAYLNRFEESLKPVLGGSIKSLRSLHCDSIELTGANWTTDLPAEFKKRRGYAMEPYMHLMLDESDPGGTPEFADAVWRLRSDMWKTLAELFDEKFLTQFHEWCHKNKTQSRNEAYGCPATDPIDAKLIADHPMCETWISEEHNIPPSETLIPLEETRGPDKMCLWGTMSNKYVSSAAHLTGRKEVSCETMTNDLSAFRTTLEQVKLGCDLNFVTGVNHPVFHGYNYNPPAAGFPGWFYCGEYFDEKNTWWEDFRKLTDYTARLSWVMQESKPYAEIALIDPLHNIWEMLHQNGYSADYVSETLLQKAVLKNGKLIVGKMSFEALVIANGWTIEPETVAAIEILAKSGAKIVFVNQLPSRYPGYADYKAQDKTIQNTLESILKNNPANVSFIRKPETGIFTSWICKELVKVGIRPAIQISSPTPLLYQIHQKLGDRDIFFFANLDVLKPASFRAAFPISGKTAWRWDPQTGKRNIYPHGSGLNGLDITLASKESLLLVFEESNLGDIYVPITINTRDSVDINATWTALFNPAQEKPFTRTMPKLIDFRDDPELISFSGTVTYKAEFDVPDMKRTILSLGKVCDISEVTLNGVNLGTRWWGEHTYDAGNALRTGRNTIEIRVTTTLSNYCLSLKDNPVARIWTSDQKRVPLPSGMIGPVRLYTQKRSIE